MGTLGAAAMATLLTAVLLTVHVPPPAVATDHVVGGSMWSIPLRDDMYLAWSYNTTFYAGDKPTTSVSPPDSLALPAVCR